MAEITTTKILGDDGNITLEELRDFVNSLNGVDEVTASVVITNSELQVAWGE